jgi:hypothetical protein
MFGGGQFPASLVQQPGLGYSCTGRTPEYRIAEARATAEQNQLSAQGIN